MIEVAREDEGHAAEGNIGASSQASQLHVDVLQSLGYQEGGLVYGEHE